MITNSNISEHKTTLDNSNSNKRKYSANDSVSLRQKLSLVRTEKKNKIRNTIHDLMQTKTLEEDESIQILNSDSDSENSKLGIKTDESRKDEKKNQINSEEKKKNSVIFINDELNLLNKTMEDINYKNKYSHLNNYNEIFLINSNKIKNIVKDVSQDQSISSHQTFNMNKSPKFNSRNFSLEKKQNTINQLTSSSNTRAAISSDKKAKNNELINDEKKNNSYMINSAREAKLTEITDSFKSPQDGFSKNNYLNQKLSTNKENQRNKFKSNEVNLVNNTSLNIPNKTSDKVYGSNIVHKLQKEQSVTNLNKTNSQLSPTRQFRTFLYCKILGCITPTSKRHITPTPTNRNYHNENLDKALDINHFDGEKAPLTERNHKKPNRANNLNNLLSYDNNEYSDSNLTNKRINKYRFNSSNDNLIQTIEEKGNLNVLQTKSPQNYNIHNKEKEENYHSEQTLIQTMIMLK